MEDNLKKILFYASIRVPFNIICHTLRHSMASHLNDNDVDFLVIQSILGHASTRSTQPYILLDRANIPLIYFLVFVDNRRNMLEDLAC